ncbi:TetR/AcrR family transcriptional regulator [Actinomadura macra]|uniref:TetR/AcrR family transcriptional regulator n=1 Tax=Actinomadura macra TaxID=46164 RepID=UPI00082AEDD9|nr:TetR/AcrR family transcriptional regulator [Actinomadura macra]
MTPRFDIDERILDAAEKLFSQIGYDLTTVKMISEVAEVDLAVLGQTEKEQIYRQVFARLHHIETTQIVAAIKKSSNSIEGIHSAVDAFLDFIVAHPELPALWDQRGLGDAADIHLSPRDYPAPLMKILTTNPWEGIAADLDLRMLAWIIIWGAGRFAHNGFVDEDEQRVFPDNPDALRRFRNQIHEIVDALNKMDTSQ